MSRKPNARWLPAPNNRVAAALLGMQIALVIIMRAINYNIRAAIRMRLALVCLITCSLTAAITAGSVPTVPRGVFDLVKVGAAINVNALSNPAVDGISIRDSWSDVNSADGVFNWSYLDNQVSTAAASGKSVLIRISDGGDNIPTWVMNGVATTFTYVDNNPYHSTYGTNITIPVFWDAYYLAKKQALIAAFGAHFTGNPAVKIASVGIANAYSDDWAIPNSASDVPHWQAVGYTTQKLVNSCNSIVDSMMNAFPNQVVVIATNPNVKLDPNPNYAQTAVRNYGRVKWGNRLVLGQDNVSAKTPSAPGPNGSMWSFWYSCRPAIAAQMLWNSYGDPTYRNTGGVQCDPATSLRSAVNAGASYGMNYLEIYQTDVINLPDVISYAHNLLNPPSS